MDASKLRLIQGGQPNKPKRKPRQFFPCECRVCECDIGIRTRALIKVRQGAMEDGKLKITGGRDVWVCASCLTRGKMTLQTT